MKINLDDALRLTSEKTHSTSVFKRKIDGKKSVIKVYSKDTFPQAIKEIIILKMINHDNIIKLDDIYEDNNKVCIVMPYIKNKLYTIENDKKNEVVKDMLKAVAYLHHNNIIYGDIKIENSLYNKSIKLIDFGSAYKFFCRSEKKINVVGTTNNQPPEIRNDTPIIYDEKIDIWTCGTFIFELYDDYYLYDEEYDILRLDFLDSDECNLDDKMKKAIIYMTVDYPSNRMSIKDVIKFLYDEEYFPDTIELPEPSYDVTDTFTQEIKEKLLDKCIQYNFCLSTTLTSICLCSKYDCDMIMSLIISSCLFENSPLLSFKRCKISDIVEFIKKVDYKIYHNISIPESYFDKVNMIKEMFGSKYIELARN